MIFLAFGCIFCSVILNTSALNQLLPLNHGCANCDGKSSSGSLKLNNPMWCFLTHMALEVFKNQNEMNKEKNQSDSSLIIVIDEVSTWWASLTFMDTISKLRLGTRFLHLQFGFKYAFRNITHILVDLMVDQVYIHSVVVFSTDASKLTKLLNTVSVYNDLKWTSLIHTTEWIVVSASNTLKNELQVLQLTLDFITLVFPSKYNLTKVVQKSRTEGFRLIAQARFTTCSNFQDGEATFKSSLRFSQRGSEYMGCLSKLRRHPLLYLKSQKSVMAGLHLYAALPENAYVRTVSARTVGNVTVFDGFSVAVMRIMAETLGFKVDFVFVTDGGDYGEVLDNATVTGITGKLARREAGMATLVSRLKNRQMVIDFLPTALIIESAHIVYRLPSGRGAVDKTYIKIIQPEFMLSLVGPLIMIAITAIVVHFATLSWSSGKSEVSSIRDLRKLNDCTESIFLRQKKESQGQTSRILAASWAVFCLILVSAYSAYLVTTFTIKPDETKIRNFEELLSRDDFRFGMHGSSKALAIVLKTSSDRWKKATWKKLIEFNKTDAQTFSLNLSYHVQRIMKGRYVFLDNFSVGSGEFFDFLPSDHADIRAYQQSDLQGTTSSFIAIPKHVFYKDALYHVQLQLEKSGVVLQLQHTYFSHKPLTSERGANSECIPVDFKRIELIVYVALAGLGLGSVCLVAEFVLKWYRKERNGEILGNQLGHNCQKVKTKGKSRKRRCNECETLETRICVCKRSRSEFKIVQAEMTASKEIEKGEICSDTNV